MWTLRDSLDCRRMIQDCLCGGGDGGSGSAGVERCGLGADGSVDHWSARSAGSTGRDNRMFVEGVLWIVRTGSPWRDLPDVFGEWNSVLRRFSRWSRKGVWWRIFEAMSDDPDFEYLIVDSTIIRAHQHAAGAKKAGLTIRHPTKPSVALGAA